MGKKTNKGRLLTLCVLAALTSGGNPFPAEASYSASGGSAQGTNAIAIGHTSTVAKDAYEGVTGAISIGEFTKATGADSIAIGADNYQQPGRYEAASADHNSIAIGGGALATGTSSSAHAISIGSTSTANRDSSMAVGYYASATGNQATAFGERSNASGTASLAVGSNANAGNGMAIGADARVANSTSGDIAIGHLAAVENGNSNSIAIGEAAYAKGGNIIAIGGRWDGDKNNETMSNGIKGGTSSTAANTVVIGSSSHITAANSIAIGHGLVARNANTVQVGQGTSVTANNSVAIGMNSTATAENTVSFGSSQLSRRATNVAGGIADTDAANAKQVKEAKAEAIRVSASDAEKKAAEAEASAITDAYADTAKKIDDMKAAAASDASAKMKSAEQAATEAASIDSAAKANAMRNAAAKDAQSKTNKAKAEAISAASQDAEKKAADAKAAAIKASESNAKAETENMQAIAAADIKAKTETAQANARSYTEASISSLEDSLEKDSSNKTGAAEKEAKEYAARNLAEAQDSLARDIDSYAEKASSDAAEKAANAENSAKGYIDILNSSDNVYSKTYSDDKAKKTGKELATAEREITKVILTNERNTFADASQKASKAEANAGRQVRNDIGMAESSLTDISSQGDTKVRQYTEKITRQAEESADKYTDEKAYEIMHSATESISMVSGTARNSTAEMEQDARAYADSSIDSAKQAAILYAKDKAGSIQKVASEYNDNLRNTKADTDFGNLNDAGKRVIESTSVHALKKHGIDITENMVIADRNVDAHSIDVSGSVSSGASVHVGNSVSVEGSASFAGDLEADTDFTVHGDQAVYKNKAVSGNSAVSGNIEAYGEASFNASAEIGMDATVGGNVSIKKDMLVDGSLHADGKAAVGGLVSEGNATVNGEFTVNKGTTIGSNAVAAGKASAKSLSADGKTYVDKNGLNANMHNVTYVTDGSIEEGSKDAVNGGQVYNVQMNAEDGIDTVGSQSAALMGLHPIFSEDGSKVAMAVAGGSYKDKTASAAGAYYSPDRNTLLSVSGTIGDAKSMGGAGFTRRLGNGSAKESPSSGIENKIMQAEQRLFELEHQENDVSDLEDKALQLVIENKIIAEDNERIIAENEQMKADISVIQKAYDALKEKVGILENMLRNGGHVKS